MTHNKMRILITEDITSMNLQKNESDSATKHLKITASHHKNLVMD